MYRANVTHPSQRIPDDGRESHQAQDRSGRQRVTGVLFEHDGEQVEVSADIVVVACGAINSAALLLRSANSDHPNGLANRSGVVGRHYMGHTNSVVMALSLCPNPTVFQKTLSVNDFYSASSEWEFPMGHISFVGKLDVDTLRAGAPAVAPGWSLELMATIRSISGSPRRIFPIPKTG